MGVPPPLGQNQLKSYYVVGLPGDLDPKNPNHRRIICQYEAEYEAYRQAREDLGRASKGRYFSVQFINNNVNGEPFCTPAKKAQAKRPTKRKAKSKTRSTKTRRRSK